MNKLRDERLKNEYEDIMKLSQYSPLISIEPVKGNPPIEYLIVYNCKGYTDSSKKKIAECHKVRLNIPEGYPAKEPVFTALTPISHPHIFNRYICVGHWSGPKLTLRQYIIGVGEMIQWKKGIDGNSKPIDNRELVGKEPEEPKPDESEEKARKEPEEPEIKIDILPDSQPVSHLQDAVVIEFLEDKAEKEPIKIELIETDEQFDIDIKFVD